MSKKGYCDYRCWFAKGKQCSCFCGGTNHGIGRAIENPDGNETIEQEKLTELFKDPIIKQYGFTRAQWEAYGRGVFSIDNIVAEIVANFNLDPEVVEMRRKDV